MLIQPKEFPNISFDSAPKCCWSNLFFDYDAQAMTVALVLLKEENEILCGDSLSKSHHPPKILRKVDSLLLRKGERSFHPDHSSHFLRGCQVQTVKRFLPFVLLLFKTFRPLLVLILSIKPWVRFRLKLLG